MSACIQHLPTQPSPATFPTALGGASSPAPLPAPSQGHHCSVMCSSWSPQQPSSSSSSFRGSWPMSYSMSSSSESKFEAIQFLLHKSIPGHGEIFYEVSEGEMRPGDIVLFPIENLQSLYCLLKHAAVYLGDGEVIHFQGLKDKSSSGRISKEGFHALKKARGKFQAWRKRGGIKVNEFRAKVRQAMNSVAYYDLGTNNCIHFALWLLGLEDFYMELVEISHKDGRGRPGGAP